MLYTNINMKEWKNTAHNDDLIITNQNVYGLSFAISDIALKTRVNMQNKPKKAEEKVLAAARAEGIKTIALPRGGRKKSSGFTTINYIMRLRRALRIDVNKPIYNEIFNIKDATDRAAAMRAAMEVFSDAIDIVHEVATFLLQYRDMKLGDVLYKEFSKKEGAWRDITVRKAAYRYVQSYLYNMKQLNLKMKDIDARMQTRISFITPAAAAKASAREEGKLQRVAIACKFSGREYEFLKYQYNGIGHKKMEGIDKTLYNNFSQYRRRVIAKCNAVDLKKALQKRIKKQYSIEK